MQCSKLHNYVTDTAKPTSSLYWALMSGSGPPNFRSIRLGPNPNPNSRRRPNPNPRRRPNPNPNPRRRPNPNPNPTGSWVGPNSTQVPFIVNCALLYYQAVLVTSERVSPAIYLSPTYISQNNIILVEVNLCFHFQTPSCLFNFRTVCPRVSSRVSN